MLRNAYSKWKDGYSLQSRYTNESRDDIDLIYKKFLSITLIIQKKDISDDGIKVFN